MRLGKKLDCYMRKSKRFNTSVSLTFRSATGITNEASGEVNFDLTLELDEGVLVDDDADADPEDVEGTVDDATT